MLPDEEPLVPQSELPEDDVPVLLPDEVPELPEEEEEDGCFLLVRWLAVSPSSSEGVVEAAHPMFSAAKRATAGTARKRLLRLARFMTTPTAGLGPTPAVQRAVCKCMK